MLAFKALSIAFRELQAPELEAAQKELAQVKARLEEVEDELSFQYRVSEHEAKTENALRRRNFILESENERLREDVESRQKAVLETISENVKLRERLSKRRRTKDSST